MNKKENTNKSIKKMLLSVSIMSCFAVSGLENVNAMNNVNPVNNTGNGIFRQVSKREPIKEGIAPIPVLAANSSQQNITPVFAPVSVTPNNSTPVNYRGAMPVAGSDLPISNPENNTETKDPSHIMNSLKESDTKNDKNTILEKVENNSVTEIPKNISDIIGKINTAELCSKEMLSLCSFICMEGYKAKRKNLNSKPIQDITSSTVDALLKDNSNTQILKAALLSISLGVYHHNQAEKIFSEKINDPLIRISAIDRKNEFDNALSYFRINADPALINIKVYTDFVQYLIEYIYNM